MASTVAHRLSSDVDEDLVREPALNPLLHALFILSCHADILEAKHSRLRLQEEANLVTAVHESDGAYVPRHDRDTLRS